MPCLLCILLAPDNGEDELDEYPDRNVANRTFNRVDKDDGCEVEAENSKEDDDNDMIFKPYLSQLVG